MPLPKDLQNALAQSSLQRANPTVILSPPSVGNVGIDPVPPSRTFKLPPTNDRPVLVQSQMIVPANSGAPGNSLNLINPNGEAMMIHEIKFAVQPYDQELTLDQIADGEFAKGLMTGGQIAVEMSLGKNPLTNGQVPIWSFGLARYLDEEAQTAYPGAGLSERSDGFYTWELKHPLFIPAGAALSVSAKSLGLVPQDSLVTVALSGVTCPDEKRDSVILPWVCHWESPPFDQTARGVAESSETDLVNMFDQDLWIERFGCRLAATFLPRGSVEVNSVVQPDVVDGDAAVFSANEVLQATVKGSNGAVLVREPTPLRVIFGSRNRAWQVSARLPPQEFIRISLLKNPAPTGYTPDNASEHIVQAFFSMVGWRNVNL